MTSLSAKRDVECKCLPRMDLLFANVNSIPIAIESEFGILHPIFDDFSLFGPRQYLPSPGSISDISS